MTEPAAPQPETPAAPAPAPEAAKPAAQPDFTAMLGGITSALESLGSRLGALETPAAPATPTAPKAKPAGPSQRETDAIASADRSMKIAKAAAARLALPGLKSETYLQLAPPVELDDAGLITDESKVALSRFRKDNPDLFSAVQGSTPSSIGGDAGQLTAQQLQSLRAAGIDPAKTQAKLENSPLAGIIGYETKARV